LGKSALIYAAQIDELAGVELLLSWGGGPAARTRVQGRRRLGRDASTPLMDAAENASAEVIEALLAAVADPAASDSRGSCVGWYLDRNRPLSAAGRAALRQCMPQAVSRRGCPSRG
jgi:ankyrin repeat protein